MCLPFSCAGAAVSEAVECTAHHLVFVQDKLVPGPRPVVPTPRAAFLYCSKLQLNRPCALQMKLRSSRALLFVCLQLYCLFWTLIEVMQFVEACSCWIAFSGALVCLADLTLSSVGYVAKLAGKVAWYCMELEVGRSGRALV